MPDDCGDMEEKFLLRLKQMEEKCPSCTNAQKCILGYSRCLNSKNNQKTTSGSMIAAVVASAL